jgi:hypothetical protein
MKKRVSSRRKINMKVISGFVIILLFVLGIVFGGILFLSPDTCYDESCFNNAMIDCDRVIWLRMDAEADWLYEIVGDEKEYCKIEVELKKIKKGKVDLEGLEGEGMICEIEKKSSVNPEEVISQCSGKLKEDLQEIIIQRMHDYLLENLGEVQEGFGRI